MGSSVSDVRCGWRRQTRSAPESVTSANTPPARSPSRQAHARRVRPTEPPLVASCRFPAEAGRRTCRSQRAAAAVGPCDQKALWHKDNHRGRRPAVWSPVEYQRPRLRTPFHRSIDISDLPQPDRRTPHSPAQT